MFIYAGVVSTEKQYHNIDDNNREYFIFTFKSFLFTSTCKDKFNLTNIANLTHYFYVNIKMLKIFKMNKQQ